MLKVGDSAPDFLLPNHDGDLVALKTFRGKKVILYFYPKDDTPGCTKEACDFRDQMSTFSQKNTIVVGLSKDDPATHQKFKQKYALPFILLSDKTGEICEAYNVIAEKIRFGKKYRGINRTTFLLDELGIIQFIWPNVKVEGHITALLDQLA